VVLEEDMKQDLELYLQQQIFPNGISYMRRGSDDEESDDGETEKILMMPL
jgi:hypothetical protein